MPYSLLTMGLIKVVQLLFGKNSRMDSLPFSWFVLGFLVFPCVFLLSGDMVYLVGLRCFVFCFLLV